MDLCDFKQGQQGLAKAKAQVVDFVVKTPEPTMVHQEGERMSSSDGWTGAREIRGKF